MNITNKSTSETESTTSVATQAVLSPQRHLKKIVSLLELESGPVVFTRSPGRYIDRNAAFSWGLLFHFCGAVPKNVPTVTPHRIKCRLLTSITVIA